MTHPTRGTCNDAGCPQHGLCHCGCGEKPMIAPQDRRRGALTRGQPWMWKTGHHNHSGCYTKRGIPVARVQPLVAWLKGQYGRKGIATLYGIPTGTLDAIQYTNKRVSPATARRIVDAVLDSRRAPPDVFAQYEVEPAVVPWDLRHAHDDAAAERKRTERARSRDRNRITA